RASILLSWTWSRFACAEGFLGDEQEIFRRPEILKSCQHQAVKDERKSALRQPAKQRAYQLQADPCTGVLPTRKFQTCEIQREKFQGCCRGLLDSAIRQRTG